ncbi:hypothetical protein Sjap_008598 [Stephania japonica]|uniref:Uncharacterized protein n=1 Tax=Stephania japonica TaxID=461633 RepID=A0AAP0JQH9_9MAGN
MDDDDDDDDDDDLQNVEFLAAVLQGGDGERNSVQENENIYDEDEDEENDADSDILQNKECSLWMPLINDPTLSVLDVASLCMPLINDPTLSVLDVAATALLGTYLHDVSKGSSKDEDISFDCR